MRNDFKVLDGLRGCTAIYVLIHHSRLILTQPYKNGLLSHPEKYEWYDKIMVYFFSIFKYGHEAVIIFFVLSGFVIHLKQADKKFDFTNFSVKRYFKKRFFRIYPTLITVMLLSLFLDFVTYIFHVNTESVFSKYTYRALFNNLFLLPNTVDWGNNSPMWSLKHEWIFYLTYPILLWLNTKNKFISMILLIGLFLSFVLGFRIPFILNIAYTLLVWFIGVLLADFYKKSRLFFNTCVPHLLFLITIYPFIDRYDNNNYPILDLTFGLIIAGFLSILIQNRFKSINYIIEKVSFLGLFSYSIYLLHYPFLNLIQQIIFKRQGINILPYNYWYVALSILITIPTIYLIYLFTERLAINYKKKIF